MQTVYVDGCSTKEKSATYLVRPGISRTTLIELYYDRSKAVSFRVVELLCRYLNCTIGDLFVIEEENHGKM